MKKIRGKIEFDLYNCTTKNSELEKMVMDKLRELHNELSKDSTGSVNACTVKVSLSYGSRGKDEDEAESTYRNQQLPRH